MYKCTSCIQEKALSEFKSSKTAKRGHRAVCKECDSLLNEKWRKDNAAYKQQQDKEWKEANPDKVLFSYFKYNLKRNFGITVEDYASILESQDNRCAICGTEQCTTGRRLAVDHDHDTGVIRGLLCQACNTGIGKLNEDVQILERAIHYLKKQQNFKVNKDA